MLLLFPSFFDSRQAANERRRSVMTQLGPLIRSEEGPKRDLRRRTAVRGWVCVCVCVGGDGGGGVTLNIHQST